MSGFLFFLLASLSIFFALIFLLIIKYSFYRGVSYSFLFFAVIQIGLGFNNFSNPKQLGYLGFIFLLIASLSLLCFLKFKHTNVFWQGIFLGLLIESFTSLILVCLSLSN